MYKLQDIFIKPYIGNEILTHMYYRNPIGGGEYIYENSEGTSVLKDEGKWDFFTYFNALSIEKWKTYTYAEKFYLVLEMQGTFGVNIFGHYLKGGHIEREVLGHYYFELEEKDRLILPIPEDIKSQVVGFEITHEEDVLVYDSYWAAEVPAGKIRKPYIALTTTTFQKEDYIRNNIRILREELFSDRDYADAFCWNIVDNGGTLPEQTDDAEKIRIFHNKNVGGAGGFARGMIAGLTQKDKPTHILLMDDDVHFVTESFKRLYKLLSILRPEYQDSFVSGAMLKMDAPNLQHEDIGKLNPKGYHEALKPGYDMNLWDSVLKNEQLNEDTERKYAAWWFCCIPVGVARTDNLPVPVFVRGDDVEFSLRNQADLISMNGICIWHKGFEGKFSAALEYYQVERNELIITAMHPELSDVDVFGHIEELFWQEVYKFNYKGASLLLDAVEDYLKGPEYFSSIDLFERLSEKRAEDNELFPVTDEVRAQIDYGKLFQWEDISKKDKFIYDYTYNGQARIPNFCSKKKVGIIPYGWGYFPGKQCLVSTIYAIEPVSDKYTVYRKDRKKFRTLKTRFTKLKSEYLAQNDSVRMQYQDALPKLTSEEFWKGVLGMK